MDYTATGMSTFASEIKREGILLTQLKAYTHFRQFPDASGDVFNYHLDHIRITQAISRVQGILNMEVKTEDGTSLDEDNPNPSSDS